MLGALVISKHKGFSLVEMIVVVALIGILAGLAASSYREWIESSRIRAAAESIQNGLQLARGEAVKRNAEVEFAFDGGGTSWSVGCVTVVADLDLDGADDCPAIIQRREQAEGSSANIAVVTNPADKTSVVFSNLGTVLADSFTEAAISSSAIAGSRELRVSVGVGGNVKMCDPSSSLPVGDPRKC